MMKQYKKQFIYSLIVTLIPAFAGIIFAGQLPDTIAVHFDFSGHADGFASKWMVILGMPVLMALLQGITLFGVLNDPKNKNNSHKMMGIVIWLVPCISLTVHSALYAYAAGWKVNIASITGILLGVVFVMLGNYMGKNRQNYTIGIRTPWTLNSHENWNRTHRLAGKIWVLTGLIMLVSSFIPGTTGFAFAVLIAGSLIPVGYSFYLYRKEI